MQPLIIDSKLSAPDCGNMLQRGRLIKRAGFERSPRLKLICADAGYGKTILMGQLYSLGPRASIWYQLDKFDGDFRVFISHLVNGLRVYNPDFGEWVNERISETRAGANNRGEVLHTFINELSAKISEPVHFYLDDYHLVQDSEQINEATRFLISHLHDGCSVIISSRVRPAGLSLGKLKAQSELVEISSADLRFTRSEAKKLLRKAHQPLKDKEITELYKRTDGWAVALALSGSVITEAGTSGQADIFPGKNKDIQDFLSEEVWASMDKAKKDLFMRASLVDTIDAALLKDVGIVHASSMAIRILADAVDRNMMIVSLGGGRHRLHPLFREFLLERLKREIDEEDLAELHKSYAQAFLDRSTGEYAIDHFLEAEEIERAMDLLIEHGDKVIDSGYVQKVESWLEKLPKDKRESAWADYFSARVYRYQGNLDKSSQVCMDAYERFSQENIRKGIFKSSTFMSDLFGIRSKFDECIEFGTIASEHTDHPDEKAEAINNIAAARVWEGDYEEAITLLNKIKKIKGCSKKIRVKNDQVSLSMMFLLGDFKKLMIRVDQVTKDEEWEGLVTNQLRFICNKATTLYMHGKYEAAYEAASNGLQLAKNTGAYYEEWILRETIGHIDFCRGNFDAGLSVISQAESTFEKLGAVDGSTLMHKGTCFRRIGNYDAAFEIYNSYLKEAKVRKNPYDTAMCLSNIGAVIQYMKPNSKKIIREFDLAELYARKYGIQYVITQIYYHRGRKAYIQGRQQAAKSFLQTALSNAAKKAHNHFIIQEGRISLEVLTFALEQDIESQYLIEIFGMIGRGSIRGLKHLLSDESGKVRLRAAKALVSAGGLEVAPLVKKLMRDQDKRVCKFAEVALKQLRSDMDAGKQTLTRREGEVFQLMGHGFSNAEIGDQLFISEQTVKTHATRIFRKLGLTRRSQAVIHFQKHGYPST